MHHFFSGSNMRFAVAALLAVVTTNRAMAQSPVERFRNAYFGTVPVRVEFRRAGAIEGDVSPEFFQTIKQIPGVTETRHPVTNQSVYDLVQGRVIYSGPQNLRLEERNRLQGGDPARSTRVSLWNSDHLARVPKVGAEMAEMRPVNPESAETRRMAHLKGLQTQDRERAEDGFVALAQYAAEALATCGDLKIEAEANGIVRLESREIGLEVRIDERTGELASAREELLDGSSMSWKWEGWLPGNYLPARHPKVQFLEFVELEESTGAKITRQGDIVYFDSITVEPEPAADRFRWTSVAPLAINLVTRKVIRPDGTLDDLATAKMEKQARPVRPTIEVSAQGQLKPAEDRRIPKRYIAIGLVAVAAAVGVWVRKRTA